MVTPGSVRKRCDDRTVSALFLVTIVLSALSSGVPASTPPRQPVISVRVGYRTVSPGSGIDIPVVWMRNAAPNSIPGGC
ncbi:MAG TPA: hypothetical protein VMC42_05535 [Methanoregulaceae archaeon]|nr:hypothetical protein [Methanoregulaceae archaeon]